MPLQQWDLVWNRRITGAKNTAEEPLTVSTVTNDCRLNMQHRATSR